MRKQATGASVSKQFLCPGVFILSGYFTLSWLVSNAESRQLTHDEMGRAKLVRERSSLEHSHLCSAPRPSARRAGLGLEGDVIGNCVTHLRVWGGGGGAHVRWARRATV
jgi:hypothetical protein